MLTKYLEAAMRHAHYEILADDGSYYVNLQECRKTDQIGKREIIRKKRSICTISRTLGIDERQ